VRQLPARAKRGEDEQREDEQLDKKDGRKLGRLNAATAFA
jgi:hypothetical protein